MRKRVLSVLLATVTAGTLLAGCGAGGANTANITDGKSAKNESVEVSESSDTTNDTSSDTSEDVINTSGKLDSKWLDGAKKYYNALVPDDLPRDEVFCIYEFSDEYRGEFTWCIYNNNFDLDYYNESDDYFSLSIDTETGEIELSIEIEYDDDTEYDVSYEPVKATNIGSQISDLSATTFEETYDDSAFASHDVRKDVSIMYERFRQLANISFAKAGTGSLEEYGLILTAIENIDPVSTLENEVPYIVSDHIFDNGICTHCNKTWAECVDESFGELLDDTKWRAKYGIHNEYACEGNSVRFYNYTGDLTLNYNALYIYPDRIGNINDDFYLNILSTDKIEIEYRYEDVFKTEQTDEYGYNICGQAQCELTAIVTPEELAIVLTSPKKLEEVCSYRITRYSPDSEEFEYFENYTEAEILAFFNEQNYSIISKTELCERLSSNAKTYILGIDKSLLEIDATLADAGIDIKKLK